MVYNGNVMGAAEERTWERCKVKFRIYKMILNETVAIELFSIDKWMPWSHWSLPLGFP